MALRVIEIVTPCTDRDKVVSALEENQDAEGYVFWASELEGGEMLSFRMILDVQETENVLEKLEYLFAWTEKYRIVIYPAEATIPRLDKLAEKEEAETFKQEKNGNRKSRISREELYDDVLDATLLSKNYVLLVIFATVVAVIGLMRDSVAVIIGAMVLAPLLGPNVGLSLATTLGDKKLGRESLKTLATGVALCFALSALGGWAMGIPELTGELAARSSTSYWDILLAIVSGAAGIISFTLGAPASLVGVMVALSLLPPLTACGLFFGAGMLQEAGGAGLLFLANVICLNLAGVVTFLAQGIQPASWWDKERARSATLRAAGVWTFLLGFMIAILALRAH